MTIEERVEKMCQLIWLDVSEPQLPLKDRYRLMKDRILYNLNAAHAEGVAEGKEQDRERIRNIVCPDEDEHGDLTIGWLSLSVLAPTKEGEK